MTSPSEFISIREASRRLGVSDTAVHKAIKSGRVKVANHTASGRPQVAWPQVQTDWVANSDQSKRTHGGVTEAAPTEPPAVPIPARTEEMFPELLPKVEPAPEEGDDDNASYAKSRAVREAYLARLAKLEYEQKAGILVSADEVRARWHKQIVAAKTRILGIPAACKSRIADLPMPVLATIEAVCREALENLANDSAAAADESA